MAENGQARQSHSLHRLPTLSAAYALEETNDANSNSISFGLRSLDALLHDKVLSHEANEGFTPGQIVEVFGPPGVGKTTLCMQATASALNSGSKVAWIDTATPLMGGRLAEVLSSYGKSSKEATQNDTPWEGNSEKLSNLSYYYAPTLSHLLFLLSSASASSSSSSGSVLSDRTVLLVVDSLSTCMDNEYPRNLEIRHGSSQGDNSRWLHDRRPAAIAEIASRLTKLSSTRNIAVLLTSTVVTKIRIGTSASLRPALSGQEWEKSINFRLALYRDWLNRAHESTWSNSDLSARFIELRPLRRRTANHERMNYVIAFGIDKNGMRDITNAFPASLFNPTVAKLQQPHKRRHEEIADPPEADSESDYGWDGEDDQFTAEGLIDAFVSRDM